MPSIRQRRVNLAAETDEPGQLLVVKPVVTTSLVQLKEKISVGLVLQDVGAVAKPNI